MLNDLTPRERQDITRQARAPWNFWTTKLAPVGGASPTAGYSRTLRADGRVGYVATRVTTLWPAGFGPGDRRVQPHPDGVGTVCRSRGRIYIPPFPVTEDETNGGMK